MCKLFIALTITFGYLAATGAASILPPPECGMNCPWVR
jgi:hypothetical protein